MNNEPVKLKRGPKAGTTNFISVPLVDLIRLCAASCSVPVNRKWLAAQGYKPNEEIPALSQILANAPVPTVAPPVVVPETSVAPVVLKIEDACETFNV